MVETQPRAAAEISRPPLVARDMEAVVVDIYDQIYQLRGVNPEYIERYRRMERRWIRCGWRCWRH